MMGWVMRHEGGKRVVARFLLLGQRSGEGPSDPTFLGLSPCMGLAWEKPVRVLTTHNYSARPICLPIKSPTIPSVLASTDYPVHKNCQFAAQFMNLIIEIEFDALKCIQIWNQTDAHKRVSRDSIVGETSDLSAFQTFLIFLSKTITYGEGLSNAFCYYQK